MKNYLPLGIILIVSVLFFLISSRTFHLQSNQLESMQLFRLFKGISSLIALFIPLALYIFYLLTSHLMFILLDENFELRKMAVIISLSFIPVTLNGIAYLIILNDIDLVNNYSDITLYTVMGLSLRDMEEINYIAWLGFYLSLTLLTKIEFELPFVKASAIALLPTLLVVMGKILF